MNHISSDNNVGQLWFRIARLKPVIRDHISVHRQEYRGQIWHVYQDHVNNRFHRFDYLAHQFISLMDGNRCVNDIWELLKSEDRIETPSQEEVFFLLGKLHRLDLLQSNTNPDTQELYQRARLQKQKRWKMFIRNPVSFRLPLFDPEKLLTHTFTAVKPLFTLTGFITWCVILLFAVILATSYWGEISDYSFEQLLQPKNLLLLFITYPFIKLLHELGHAYAVKRWGGEVHEIGIIFVLLIPIPYVDASAASAFTRQHQRIIVGAAGIFIEIFLACIALFAWLTVEPGLIHTLAFNVMLIAGVSTLFFNGNPLLRYDGYYVLTDTIGIPNLSYRSNRYIGYLIQRYLFNIKDVPTPAHDPGERFWFAFYSPASFVYRMFILAFIIMLVADQWLLLGITLGLWIFYNQILLPLFKHTRFLLSHPGISQNRPRAIMVSGAMMTLLAGILFALPFPLVTVTQGIIWTPDNAKIHAGTNGFVSQVLVKTGQEVDAGQKLIVLEDPLRQTEINILYTRMEELKAQYSASWSSEHVQSKIIKEKISFVQQEIERSEKLNNALIVRSPAPGKVIIPGEDDLNGSYFKQGDFIAYIIPPTGTTARVVIRQENMGRFDSVNGIDVAFIDNLSNPVPARINRIFPESNRLLPDAALGHLGGGDIEVDVADETGLSSIEKVQHIEIDIQEDHISNNERLVGKRVYVRFEHGNASLAEIWYKSIQQLFLRRYSV